MPLRFSEMALMTHLDRNQMAFNHHLLTETAHLLEVGRHQLLVASPITFYSELMNRSSAVRFRSSRGTPNSKDSREGTLTLLPLQTSVLVVCRVHFSFKLQLMSLVYLRLSHLPTGRIRVRTIIITTR